MPRSPSRDLADRYAGNRGYFHQPDGIRKAKNGLALTALVAVGAWAAYDFLMPAKAAYSLTHGPLASVHSSFDTKCEACHVGQSVSSLTPGSLFNPQKRWLDLSCTKCHAGPPHHEKTMTAAGLESTARCESCHHDHLGRTNSLVRIADGHCARCHGDLPANTVGGKAEYAAKVTSFVNDHPEFRILKEFPPGTDLPRKMKFSHALHMAPGQVYVKGGNEAWTLDQIPPEFRERYRKAGQGDKAPVQLDCASCHQLDSGTGSKLYDLELRQLSGQPQQSILPPRAEGAYYLPVNYDAHCKACHPLKTPDSVTAGKTVVDAFTVPHRLQVDELKSFVRAGFADRLASDKNPALMGAGIAPGGRLTNPLAPEVKTFGADIERLTKQAVDTLLIGAAPAEAVGGKVGRDTGRFASGGYACGKCHDKTGSGDAVQIAKRDPHTVWFAHAKFNHVAHRGVSCTDCHPGTGAEYRADGAVNVVEREPLRISGVDSCRKCHAPLGTKDGQPVGGVRSDCTMCHRYHNGDHPLQGRGALDRDPGRGDRSKLLSIDDWLRGGTAAPAP